MVKRVNGTNVMPGGRLHEFEIDPTWVIFSVGSSLYQYPSTIADMGRLTISMGVQVLDDVVLGQDIDLLVVQQDPTTAPGDATGSFRLYYSAAIKQFGFAITGPGAKHLFLTAVPVSVMDGKYHLFVSVDTNFGIGSKLRNLYINGADALQTITDTSASFSASVAGECSVGLPLTQWSKTGGPNFQDISSAIKYSYVQAWFGQYIDPSVVRAGGRQPAVTTPLISEVVDGANNYGLDPLVVLTYMGVETEFGLQRFMNEPGNQYKGIFQFSQPEINYSASKQPGTGTNLQRTADQMDAFYYYYTNPARGGTFVTWQSIVNGRPAITSDPTGIYHYLAHNQGPGGFNAIYDAITAGGGATIGSMRGSIPKNMLTQKRWSKPEANNTDGLPTTPLTRSSTVGQWWSRLQTLWTNMQARAADKLTTGGIPNIEYFYKNGLLRTPSVAQNKFGKSEIWFGGVMADMIVNQGTGGNFTVEQIVGITDEP